MLDGSNDIGLQNMYAVTFCIFDVNFSQIMTKFFDMNSLEGTDASTAVFDNVNNLSEWYNIQRNQRMGIGLDNRNANIEEQNSIKSQACPCHIGKLAIWLWHIWSPCRVALLAW